MSFKRLTANAAKRILDALHPRFLGRDQDHLLALADEATDDGYTQMQDYVQPLYDFRNTVINGGYVVSFKGRSGIVVPATGDYTFAQIGSTPTTLAGYGITDAAPLSHVGSGGAAHAAVVASGANGFMTGTDKAKLDGIAAGATANTGTVTSVAVANATGITWTGSPITTSGTLTPALSANLQAWSGLATSAKQDASANLTSWSGITPATKADDSAVVHKATTETVTGAKTFSGGVSVGTVGLDFGSVLGASNTDLSKHIQLHVSAGYGFGITSGRLNYNVGTSGSHAFLVNGTDTFIVATNSVTYNGLEVGFRKIPLTAANAAYTLQASDAGKGMVHNDTVARTYTVPANVFTAGDVVTLVNDNASAVLTAAQGTSLTMYLAGTATTGNRSIAARGIATIVFTSATTCYISGPGVT